jgi:GT2 family glycosyltransferase
VTDLSIVLLTWNGRDLALDCLASIDREIRARTDAGRLDTEVIVVDNGSTDGSVEAIRARFPWAELVALPRNVGFAGGNNAGLARAKGRMVCLLNNDTIVQHDGFEACVRYLDAHPDVGAVGPQLLHPDGRKQNSIHNFPTLLLEIVPRGVLETLFPSRYPSKRFEHDAPLDVEAVLGACMVVRREVIEQVGPMPEDYFFFLEETDWFYAMRRAGWRVVHLPDAKLVHIHGAST